MEFANNLYFEKTTLELSSNKTKIEELNTTCDNLKEELVLKDKQLQLTIDELTLARNNYIIRQKR